MVVNGDQQSIQNSSNGEEERHTNMKLAQQSSNDESDHQHQEIKGEGKQNGQTNDISGKIEEKQDLQSNPRKDVEQGKEKKKSTSGSILHQFISHQYIAWIPTSLKNKEQMKNVVRSGLVAWICMVFILITPVRNAIGQANFLVLIGVFIAPADAPFIAVIERELFIVLFTCIAWAYSNLAIFFAHLARKNSLSPLEAKPELIYSGEYVELAPTAICLTFLGIGGALLLYLKVKFGMSPFLFAAILGCIAIDITLVFAPLYPFPLYTLGQAVVVPLALKAAVSIFVSLVFFPKSVNSAFIAQLKGVLAPLEGASKQLAEEMKKSPLDSDFNFELMRNKVFASIKGFVPLQGVSRLLLREVSFSLISGRDLKGLLDEARRLIPPADGIAFYFNLIHSDIRGMDIMNHPNQAFFSQMISPGQTTCHTPNLNGSHTPAELDSVSSSRPGTPGIQESTDLNLHSSSIKATDDKAVQLDNDSSIDSNAIRSTDSSSKPRHRFPSKLGHLHLHQPTYSLQSAELRKRLHEVTHSHNHRRQRESAVEVGLWESIRYTAFETQFHGRENDHITEMCMRILAQASEDLSKMQSKAFADIRGFLDAVDSGRAKKFFEFVTFRSTKVKDTFLKSADGSPRLISDVIRELEEEIQRFKVRKEEILQPFRSSLDPTAEGEKIAHRYLFQSLTFCHFQIIYSQKIVDFLRKLEFIEQNRLHYRFWMPILPAVFKSETWQSHPGDHDNDHDEDPEEIPGMVSTLGLTRARDPDAINTGSRSQEFFIKLSKFLHSLYRGNSLFMIKVGVLTVLVALPLVYKKTVKFTYAERAIWVVIMAQLSAARHRGEVLFSLYSRVISTFFGAIFGMLIWYISSGSGVANPFALAVVTAIAFPMAMLYRICAPAAPLTRILVSVTIALVVGYSWKDAKDPGYGNVGSGWPMAWRRFVEVVIGTAAAYVISWLPPTSNSRTYYRKSHATILRETGGLFCEHLRAASHTKDHKSNKEIIHKLLFVRQRIHGLEHLKSAVAYEWSIKGKWPVHRYEALERTELRILRLIAHMITIYESLGPAYSRALLTRTRFLDPSFLADCIAILSMCTISLSTGQPLPQITPVLIDRYMKKIAGFKVYDKDGLSLRLGDESVNTPEEESLLNQLPSKVTFETLADEKYQTFAVGATVAFGIIVHLDRLCVSVKKLVGETYAIPADLRSYQPFPTRL